MKLLTIDSAFETCSVGLYLDGDVQERFQHAPQGHASLLLPWVEELLAGAELGLAGLDAIAFTRGPGSFTGLRIGISVVQGLAWGADIPVIPVSSLAATAQGARKGSSPALVAMDARMQEVYTARFHEADGLMVPAGEESVCAPEVAAAMVVPGDLGVGNGFTRYEELEQLEGLSAISDSACPRAEAIALQGLSWCRDNDPLPADKAQPVYLRDRVAEKPSA